MNFADCLGHQAEDCYILVQMEQFRQIGEVLGSMKALMVLRDDIQLNQRQCCLLLDVFSLAFKTLAEVIKQSLRLEEKNTRWKPLENPLKELRKIFKEGEVYIKSCLDAKEWWGRAMIYHQNKDCVELHIHNLLSCFHAIIEAIETLGDISGNLGQYEKEWDPKFFQLKLGKQYLIPRDICSRFDAAWREDRWLMIETVKEKRNFVLNKAENRLGELLIELINGSESCSIKLFPSSILVGSKDYQVRRRLGEGNQYKEIQWLGEHFVVRHFFHELEPLNSEISSLLLLSHPNIMQYLCGFYDDEKKECFLVMELMNKDLSSYIKENCGPRRRMPFSLPIAVDLMLQIARGMEYLHSKKIYHGDLDPSNVFLKARINSSAENGYFHAKVSGFGLSTIKNHTTRNNLNNQTGAHSIIWYAPEVLAEQENPESKHKLKHTEKADVYSFGMICFELLTGKVPFEDGHLQGEKMSRNIRAGERPLFPSPSPRYLANLIKKCWQTDPIQRPSFSSICRILRYIKQFLLMSINYPNQLEFQLPSVDYCELEAGFLRRFVGEGTVDVAPVWQIPFQMFTYRLLEKEKTTVNLKDKCWESASDVATVCGYENLGVVEDLFSPASDGMSVCSETVDRKPTAIRKSIDGKDNKGARNSFKGPGTPRAQTRKSSLLNPCSHSLRVGAERQYSLPTAASRHRRAGHASDSEIR